MRLEIFRIQLCRDIYIIAMYYSVLPRRGISAKTIVLCCDVLIFVILVQQVSPQQPLGTWRHNTEVLVTIDESYLTHH